MTWEPGGLDPWLDLASLVLLVGAGALTLAAGVGLLRFPDAVTRLHAGTKPQILGLVLLVLALALQARSWDALLLLSPILVLQMLTAPISAHMIARAAYRTGNLDPRRTPIDELAPAVERARREPDDGAADRGRARQ